MNEKQLPTISWGTALLVTAAFIGPGTVLTASKAGATLGYHLLWAVVFSVVATCILQTLAARLGIATGAGINSAIRETISNKPIRWMLLGLILLAILYGNSAYQTGNLLGAVAGLSILTGWSDSATSIPVLVLAVGGIATAFVWCGGLGIIQKILMVLVAVMSILFVAAALGSQPDAAQIAGGLIPRIPASGSLLLIIGLIGTTVVPYNLFLHSCAVAEQWKAETNSAELETASAAKDRAIRRTTWDTLISVALGGLITAAILIAAANAFAGETSPLKSVKDVALQLRPTIGAWAEIVFAVGLVAAGLTSAITAPIAAGYCAAGCFQWPMKLSDTRVRLVASLVIAIGVLCGTAYGGSPLQTILLAQVANGLVLPLMAVFLLYATNQPRIMGTHANGWLVNVLGIFVIVVTTIIASRTFLLVWQKLAELGKAAG